MFFLRHILIYTACAILVLHNMTPHAHHDEMSSEVHEIEHREADSLLDWFKLAFHSDMGEGHLENFISADSQLLDLDLSYNELSVFAFTICENSEADMFDVQIVEMINPVFKFLIRDRGTQDFLRGPPRHS